MNCRAQTALEYLMSYGLALVLIVVFVGSLAFVLVSPSTVSFSSSDPMKMVLKTGLVSEGAAKIKLQNITGGEVKIVSLAGEEGYSDCRINDKVPSGTDPVSVKSGSEMFVECTASPGETGRVLITYTDYANIPRSVGIFSLSSPG